MASPTVHPDAMTVMRRCDELAGFSEEPGRLTRRFATPALREAGEAVARWMREAGMTTRRDAIGNVVGRLGAREPGAPTLILGSHLDTVRDAGRYDGPLGVLVAIACVQRLRAAGVELPFAVEVVAFADEEGVRYGTAYLGSGVLAGRFDRAALERRDADGVRMADAIAAWGGDVDALEAERRDPAGVLGYCEVHIEQGPVLEGEGLPVGVVSAIAGQTRAQVVFAGSAGHAGTVPMDLRRDALTAAAQWILAVEALARAEDRLVATVGEVEVEPGASNVVPGQVSLSLDVRHPRDEVRVDAAARLRERADAIARARGMRAWWSLVQETPAVACSAELADALGEAVADTGHPVGRLPSGGGHDAAVMAALGPVAMLFVRCAGGVSHHPAEAVDPADVAVAVEVLSGFVERLGRRR
ncbi:MAG: allantoate deiminase [Solirubrobacteraceae bacterium]|jgi:allantoate deiminase|nr:allantoate deiminase [Solirubrobacteraceae bacterium]